MKWIQKNAPGMLVCLAIAAVAWLLGGWVPLVGSPVFAILLGMIAALWLKGRESLRAGISFTSKRYCNMRSSCWGSG